jgi:hypothetical protein
MSSKRDDRGKLYHKLHQIQKRLFRSKINPEHHSYDEDKLLKVRERRLLERIKKTFKLS